MHGRAGREIIANDRANNQIDPSFAGCWEKHDRGSAISGRVMAPRLNIKFLILFYDEY